MQLEKCNGITSHFLRRKLRLHMLKLLLLLDSGETCLFDLLLSFDSGLFFLTEFLLEVSNSVFILLLLETSEYRRFLSLAGGLFYLFVSQLNFFTQFSSFS